VVPEIGSFIIEGDERFSDILIQSDIGAGTNVSYSFDPNTFRCGCCGDFNGQGRGIVVWAFTDQNFPPCLPAHGQHQCIKIIREENGDLLSMVSKFLIRYGAGIKNKDIILIGSASQLAREGLEGYVASVLDCMDRLSVWSRSGCKVLPCPFVLLGGNNVPLLTNAILDFHGWVRLSGMDAEGGLNDSFGVIEHAFSHEEGEKVDWGPSNFKLPLNLPSRKKLCVSSTGRT
jgi:hypothetical protein